MKKLIKTFVKKLIKTFVIFRYLILALVVTFAIGYGSGSSILGVTALMLFAWFWLHDELKSAPYKEENEDYSEEGHDWGDPYDFRK